MRLKVFFYFFLISAGLFSQRDTSLKIGLSIYGSYYIPSNNTASYYNGSDNNRLESYIGESSNSDIRRQIRDLLGGYEYRIVAPSENMVYNNALAFELELDYRFKNNWRFLFHFLNCNLTAVGDFTLQVDRRNPDNQTLDPYLEVVTATGEEQRNHIMLGFGRIFPIATNLLYTAEAGFDMNFIEVVNNQIIIEDQRFGLPTFNNVQNPQAQEITTFGTGFFISTGLAYELESGYGFNLKFNYFNTSININNVLEANTNLFTIGVGLSKAW